MVCTTLSRHADIPDLTRSDQTDYLSRAFQLVVRIQPGRHPGQSASPVQRSCDKSSDLCDRTAGFFCLMHAASCTRKVWGMNGLFVAQYNGRGVMGGGEKK